MGPSVAFCSVLQCGFFCVLTKGKQLLFGSSCVLGLDCDILHVILMVSPNVVVKILGAE